MTGSCSVFLSLDTKDKNERIDRAERLEAVESPEFLRVMEAIFE
jgi:hypothetical protein